MRTFIIYHFYYYRSLKDLISKEIWLLERGKNNIWYFKNSVVGLKNRIGMTEEAFNRSENMSIAIIQSGEQRVKYIVKN